MVSSPDAVLKEKSFADGGYRVWIAGRQWGGGVASRGRSGTTEAGTGTLSVDWAVGSRG